MSEKSPGEQRIGLLKRDEQPSVTLDPARACFHAATHAAKSLRLAGWVCIIAVAGDRNRQFPFYAIFDTSDAKLSRHALAAQPTSRARDWYECANAESSIPSLGWPRHQ